MIPTDLEEVLKYCLLLEFEEEPNYAKIIKKFKESYNRYMNEIGEICSKKDFSSPTFDWNVSLASILQQKLKQEEFVWGNIENRIILNLDSLKEEQMISKFGSKLNTAYLDKGKLFKQLHISKSNEIELSQDISLLKIGKKKQYKPSQFSREESQEQDFTPDKSKNQIRTRFPNMYRFQSKSPISKQIVVEQEIPKNENNIQSKSKFYQIYNSSSNMQAELNLINFNKKKNSNKFFFGNKASQKEEQKNEQNLVEEHLMNYVNQDEHLDSLSNEEDNEKDENVFQKEQKVIKTQKIVEQNEPKQSSEQISSGEQISMQNMDFREDYLGLVIVQEGEGSPKIIKQYKTYQLPSLRVTQINENNLKAQDQKF